MILCYQLTICWYRWCNEYHLILTHIMSEFHFKLCVRLSPWAIQSWENTFILRKNAKFCMKCVPVLAFNIFNMFNQWMALCEDKSLFFPGNFPKSKNSTSSFNWYNKCMYGFILRCTYHMHVTGEGCENRPITVYLWVCLVV